MATVTAEERRDALVERLFEATVGAFDLAGVYLGERLGLYRALAERGPMTAAELADEAGIEERYAREWLEHQAASSILAAEEWESWRFRLPEGHDEALVDTSSLNYVAPFSMLMVACLRPIDALMEAYRFGGGVPYADYGADLHEGQAAFTRPLFSQLLTTEWLPAVPDLHERLASQPPARIADVACGLGWSTIALARGYPGALIDGIDLDEASIEAAKRNLAGSDVEDRVKFVCRDAADLELHGKYDLVTMFESLHDMSFPVDVLRACRGLLAAGAPSSSGTSSPPTRSARTRASSSASTTASASSTVSLSG